MKGALITVICIMVAFTATGIACAVWISLRPRRQADPFANPFGDMPRLDDALRHPPGRTALRSNASGGGYSIPSTSAVARTFLRGGARV